MPYVSNLYRWRALAVLPLLMLLAQGCGPSAAAGTSARQRGYRGVVLPTPLSKPAFSLTDTRGATYDFRARTAGKLTLVYLGYTNCPDVCPVHLANLAAVLRTMPEVARRTEVVFITADPARDTPERIRAWLDNFDPRFVGLRGTPAQTRSVEAALELPRSLVPDTARGAYRVGHAAQVIAFSPDGHAHVVYPFGTRQQDWATDLPRLLDDRWGER